MEKLPIAEEQKEEYSFLGLRFFPNDWQVEILGEENPISLTKVQRELLLALVKNANSLVSYEDLRSAVWGHEPVVDQRLIHNIHVTKSKLAGLFESRGIESSFIETIEGEGYKLNADMVYYPTGRHERPAEDAEFNQAIDTSTPDIAEMAADNSHTISSPFSGSASRASKINRKFIFGSIAIFILAVVVISFITHSIIFNLSGAKILEPADSPSDKANKNISGLRLEKAELLTKPIAGDEFYLHIDGINIDPEKVRLKVTGPGCGGDDPCIVPNGSLRLYGDVTGLVVEKAPLTLARGEYQIWLENGPEEMSNKLTIIVGGGDTQDK
jgi:DNA-binding winged helix-turn-helix (wHTH) protein